MANVFWKDLIGRETAKTIFSYFAEENKFPTTILLSGAKGSGKKEFLYSFLQTLFCENGDVCGTCSGCIKFEKRVHPDLIIFKEGESVKIGNQKDPEPESIRYLIRKKLPFSPQESKYRIIIFEQAELIRPEAETALLKSLEDGPEHTIFFLMTSKKSAIKNTIKSRSVIIPFNLFSYDDLKKRVKEEDEKEFQILKEELEELFSYPFGRDVEYILKGANYNSFFKNINIPAFLNLLHSSLLNMEDRLKLEDVLLNWSSKGSLKEPYVKEKSKWDGSFLSTFRFLINLYLPFLMDCKKPGIAARKKYILRIYFSLLRNLDDYTSGVFPYALSVFFSDLLYLDYLIPVIDIKTNK